MQLRLAHWVVLFFTRPVRWSDAKAVLGRLEPRGRRSDAAPELPDEPPARPSRPVAHRTAAPAAVAAVPARAAAVATGPAADASFDYSAEDMAVSEQPLDSLPAELQMELASMTAGRSEERAS